MNNYGGNSMKRIISAILIACVLLAMSVCLFACDGGNGGDGENNNGGNNQTPEKPTYTVTVVDQDGNPVKDAQIFLSPEGGVAFPMPTNAEGKVSYTTDKKLTASVLSLPKGYEYSDLTKTQQFDANGNLTVTVTKVAKEEGTKYIIRVVDQNNDPVVGARVQMCESANEGVCLVPVTTDDNGEGIYTVAEKDYKAALTELPAGYEAIDSDYVYFENGVAVIKVTKLG